MVTIAYAHDGNNQYDLLFLDYLTQKNLVYLLTFYSNPRFVSPRTRIMKVPKIFCAPIKKAEGVYMYAFFLPRALLLRIFCRLTKPHIVLGNMTTKYGFYTAVSRFKPFVLIIWGSDILIAPKRFFLLRFMVQYTLRKADAVIVDSDVQEKAAIRFGCNPKKILKFPWFDISNIQISRSRNSVRKKLGWLDNPIVISLRKHNPIYCVEDLIEAIPKVLNALPEVRFLLLGRGQLTDKLKQRVRELGVKNYVKFLGNLSREETITYLNASDIYVSTSLSDGTSSSLLEAMTLKIPAIVTDIPGNREWIKHGWNGYLIPVRNSQEIAKKIIALARDGAFRQSIGENACKTIEERVDWNRSSKSLDALISRLTRK